MTDDLALDLAPLDEMRKLYLVRHEAESGDSETGMVATGVVFPEPNGRVVLGWLTDPVSVEVLESLDALFERYEEIGSTEIVFPTEADR